MFKKTFPPAQTQDSRPRFHRLAILGVFVLLLTSGCRTGGPFPKVNLSESGWTVHEGQAVWRAKRTAPEIAGEILLATNNVGQTFVQFTKTPFPFVIAQTTTNAWQIEAPAKNRVFSAHGKPPARVIWLQLAPACAGAELPPRYSWKSGDSGWSLENTSTGEKLEGYFK
jgi:hypothetical protein